MRVVMEFQKFQDAERDNLRAIRRHRARRATWRHMIRVRRIRGVLLGAVVVAVTVGCVAADPMHEATFAVLTIPAAFAAMWHGV